MIEEKLFCVQKGPEDVLIGFLFALRRCFTRLGLDFLFQVRPGEFHFFGIRVATERDVVEVGDFIVVRARILGEPVGSAIAAGELGLDVSSVQEMQALR